MPNALVASLGLFTVIPVPPVAEIDRPLAGRALAALPWVGLIVGGIAGGVLALASLSGVGVLPAVAALAVLAWLTGALHLDGVADTADGLGSRKPAEDALAIMKRSDIGPMGVITLVFVLLFDVAALDALGDIAVAAAPVGDVSAPVVPPGGVAPQAAPLSGGAALVAPLALMVAAMLGRLVVGFAARTPTARPGGFGALFSGASTTRAVVLNSAAVLAIALGFGWLAAGVTGLGGFGVAALVAGAAGWWWQRHLHRRFGGMTGDTFGSLIEVTQATFLVVAALVLSALT
ncbi:MAG TPA: adenosylcobinamide-GDP ribazoletransferase [Arachnia sp.]|nr:adenosylcobinamide-GDP ribazoletransferase [Arachnia sp.]HMT87517.1 adenosylcobinamide-GDP ribazoletransferase [Arachnia sp.]